MLEPSDDQPQMLTTGDVAKMLGVSTGYVIDQLIATKRLRAIRFTPRGLWRIPRDAVNELIVQTAKQSRPAMRRKRQDAEAAIRWCVAGFRSSRASASRPRSG